nr:hypothetical protein HK105_006704 [Polyrhizophydium stewartii]
MVYHHLLNKYDNSLRKAHDWLEEWSRPDKFYRDMPKHLVVLHHGLWGNDAHLGQIVRFLSEVAAARGGGAGVGADAGDAQATPIAITDGNALEVAEAIAARAKEPLPESAGDLLFLNASSSAGSLTYDGVDVCGDRLLHSVLGKLAAHGCEPARALSAKSASAENELSADKPEGDDIIDRISLIGYSLGGLIIRYVIGRLDAAGVFDAVRPVNFITLATPHLGTVKPPVSVMTRTYNAVQRSLVGRSGRQMVLADKFHDTNAPLLLLMADTRGVFVRALAKFANRAVFANARNDMTVRYTTSAITASNPFSKYKEIQVDAARYPSIVVPSDSEPKPREPWTSRQIAFVSFISLLSPILLPLWITMLSLGLATLSIKARLREGQIVDDSDWLTGKAQPPALSPARTPSDGADARSGLDSDPKQGQTSPDKPPPAGSPLHELSAQQAAALEPPRQREWMIESLNTLVWRRVNVSLFFTNAHAAIVLRRGAGAGGANVLLYLAREIFRYE